MSLSLVVTGKWQNLWPLDENSSNSNLYHILIVIVIKYMNKIYLVIKAENQRKLLTGTEKGSSSTYCMIINNV